MSERRNDMNNHDDEGFRLLVNAILSLESEQECEAFLEDLMTRKEIADMSQRIMVAERLSKRAVYTKIAEETGASSATISRVNRALQYGSGGYNIVLSRNETKS